MMEELAQDRKVRGQKKAILTRFINKTPRHIAEENESKVKEHIEKLMDAFAEFEQVHERYHQLLETDEDIEGSDSYFFQAENAYVKALSEAKNWGDQDKLLVKLKFT